MFVMNFIFIYKGSTNFIFMYMVIHKINPKIGIGPGSQKFENPLKKW